MVGIDLGTSNTVVACASPGARGADRSEVPQLSRSASCAAPALPSVLYAPLAGEVDVATSAACRRAFARDRGVEVPGRSVVSAKSWLGHGAVDRRAPILPWGAGDDVPGSRPWTRAPRCSARSCARGRRPPFAPARGAGRRSPSRRPSTRTHGRSRSRPPSAWGSGPRSSRSPRPRSTTRSAARSPEDGLVLVVDVGGGRRTSRSSAWPRAAPSSASRPGGTSCSAATTSTLPRAPAEERLGARSAGALRAARRRAPRREGASLRGGRPPQATVTVLGRGAAPWAARRR